MTKRCLASVCALAIATFAPGYAATPQPANTILVSGSCVVEAPVAGPWDVYQDMFGADAPTWLPSHTHNGIECTLATDGTAMWWFADGGKVPLPSGKAPALLTIPGRVHTAGNDGPKPMRYFAAHVLVAGSPYRTLVPDPSAPPVVSTKATSFFHNVFPNQPAIAGTFTVAMLELSIPPGGQFGGTRGSGNAYYTLISGAARVTIDGTTTTYQQYAQWSAGPGAHIQIVNAGKAAAVVGITRIT